MHAPIATCCQNQRVKWRSSTQLSHPRKRMRAFVPYRMLRDSKMRGSVLL